MSRWAGRHAPGRQRRPLRRSSGPELYATVTLAYTCAVAVGQLLFEGAACLGATPGAAVGPRGADSRGHRPGSRHLHCPLSLPGCVVASTSFIPILPLYATLSYFFCAVVPSTRVVAFRGRSLQHGLQAFVASTASIIGDVSLGEMSSAWYGATLKGK